MEVNQPNDKPSKHQQLRTMVDCTIDKWVDATVDREPAIINDYAGSIDLGVYSVGLLMKDLEPYLAQETDLIKVAKALKILAPVLSNIQVLPGRADVHVLVEYLCARLENKDKLPTHRAGIREVTAALQVLSTWRTFPPADAAIIATAINELSEGYTFKDQTLTTRLELFRFADLLVKKHERPLKRDMKDEKVVSWINSMALAEKNLSCLVILFPLYTHIGKTWNLPVKELEECWDSFIRYFPISIGNPTKDPSVPSQAKLRELLLECITSNDNYAPKAFTRLIDNLDTESDLSANTKKEVFATLVACIRAYSPEVVDKWTIKIWDALKFEVWNGDNTDFIEGSLNVLAAIATALPDVSPAPVANASYEDWSDAKDPKSSYITYASNECRTRIMDSRRQYLQPSARILKALASASPYACYLVTSSVLPALLVLWQDITLGSEKKMLLGMFNGILESRVQHIKPLTQVDGHYLASDARDKDMDRDRGAEALKGSFAKFKDNLTTIYLDLMPDLSALDNNDSEKDTTVAAAAMRGLALLFKVPEYLAQSEKIKVVTELCAIVMNDNSQQEMRENAIGALQRISASDPDIYQSTTLELFAGQLPEALSSVESERASQITSINTTLDYMVMVSCSMPCLKENDMGRPLFTGSSFWHRNFDATINKLLSLLTEVLRHGDQTPYLQAIVVTTSVGLRRFDQALDAARTVTDEPYFHGPGPYTWIVKRLLNLVLESKESHSGSPYIGISNTPSNKTALDEKTINLLGIISMTALRSTRSRVPLDADVKLALTSPHPFSPLTDFVRSAEPHVIWTLFTDGGDKFKRDTISNSQFKLDNAPADKVLANLLSMYLLAGFYLREDEIKHGAQDVLHFDPGVVASAMLRSATIVQPDHNSPIYRMTMLWMLQLLVNKYRALNTAPLFDEMNQLLAESKTKSELEMRYTLQTLAYFAAASLAALQPVSTRLIKLMLEGVADPQYGGHYAANFKVLLAPSHIMNTKNFCNLRPLRFMKVFNLVFDRLRAMWAAGDREIKDNALIALAGILDFIDAKIYGEPDVASTLLPLVLDGTNIKKAPETRRVYIKTLNNLVAHRAELVEEYLKSIITRMTDRTDSDVASRGLALDVLGSIIRKLPATAVLKEKALLTQELNLLLNDQTREVREKAQKCKTALLCLDEPKDE